VRTSPTQRSLAECRKRGLTVQVVERWNSHARVRVDLFGVIDLVALIPPKENLGGTCCIYKRPYDCCAGEYTCATCGTTNHLVPGRILGIQACAGSSHSKRLAKILAEPRARQWVESGGLLEVWSFSKRGPRGKAKRWALRVDSVTVERFDLAASVSAAPQMQTSSCSNLTASGETS
jgi:hypothetical protein